MNHPCETHQDHGVSTEHGPIKRPYFPKVRVRRIEIENFLLKMPHFVRVERTRIFWPRDLNSVATRLLYQLPKKDGKFAVANLRVSMDEIGNSQHRQSFG
jgi:hypothetical protein